MVHPFLDAVQAQVAQTRQHQPPSGGDGPTEWTEQEQGLCVVCVVDCKCFLWGSCAIALLLQKRVWSGHCFTTGGFLMCCVCVCTYVCTYVCKHACVCVCIHVQYNKNNKGATCLAWCVVHITCLADVLCSCWRR